MRPFIINRTLLRIAELLACAILAALVVILFAESHPVKALPEYAALTGESCSVCHVNPGGGGPRTLRGLLWAARNKPIQIPDLPAILLAPDVQDGYEMYDIACAGCHGAKGEGSSAISLSGTGISAAATRSYIFRGILPLGMPAFKGQLTDVQLEVLVKFVTGLGDGTVSPPPDSFPLAPAQLHGKPAQPPTKNEGN